MTCTREGGRLAPDVPVSVCARAPFGRVLAICIISALSCGTTNALGQTKAVSAPDGRRDEVGNALTWLDIPSQPLQTALEAFRAAARVDLFYESDVVMGRRSSAVRGQLPADAALRLLLEGTGLSSASFASGTITILAPSRDDEASEIKRVRARVVEFAPYLAAIQKSLDQAFCRAPILAMDPDELLARLWISPSGRVAHADLLWTTGSEQRDRLYVTTLATLTIELPPPAAMPQPVNLMIMPRKSRSSAACVDLGTDLRSAAHE
jgi:hypothetical protein